MLKHGMPKTRAMLMIADLKHKDMLTTEDVKHDRQLYKNQIDISIIISENSFQQVPRQNDNISGSAHVSEGTSYHHQIELVIPHTNKCLNSPFAS